MLHHRIEMRAVGLKNLFGSLLLVLRGNSRERGGNNTTVLFICRLVFIFPKLTLILLCWHKSPNLVVFLSSSIFICNLAALEI